LEDLASILSHRRCHFPLASDKEEGLLVATMVGSGYFRRVFHFVDIYTR
jgi:hypothetical protein